MRTLAEANEADMVDQLDTTQRYDIADTYKECESILEWVHTNRSDVAMKILWHSKYAHILTP
jgi:hypothetical protein